MGIGDPLEASIQLAGPIRAGTWHLIGDGIVIDPVDIRYDVLWRHGGTDTTIVSYLHHFEPLTGADKFNATMLDADASGSAVPAQSGDELVLRWTALGGDGGAPGADGGTGNLAAFIPNGDGVGAKGRIPSLKLPR